MLVRMDLSLSRCEGRCQLQRIGGAQRVYAQKSCRRFPDFVAWINLVPAGREFVQPLKRERHRCRVKRTTARQGAPPQPRRRPLDGVADR